MRKRLFVVLLAGVLLVLGACSGADRKVTGEEDNIQVEEAEDEGTLSTDDRKEEVKDPETDSTEQTQVTQEAESEDFSEQADKDYVLPLFNWSDETKDYRFDLFEDGIEDTIQLALEDPYKYILSVNGRSYVLDRYSSYFSKAFLVIKDENYYVYLQLKYDTDDWQTRTIEVLEITKDMMRYAGSFSGQLMDFEDPNHFQVRDYVNPNLMETECYVGIDGMPVSVNNRYKLIQYDKRRTYDYISLTEIPAELVDEQGNLLGKTENFPAGTQFLLVYTDGSTYYDVKSDDGRYCRHYISMVQEGEDSYLMVNGLDFESCLEEFSAELPEEEIRIEALFEEQREEAYQEKFRQLLPYVSDDMNVCNLSGETLQCNVTKRKITNQWIELGEVEFVVESASEQFHHDNFQIPAETLEQNIKQALGKAVGEDFVLDHYWCDLYDDTYRYTILEITKNKALGNKKETVEYGDTIRATCCRTEDAEYNSEFLGSFLLQVDRGVAKFLESDYPFSEQLIKKIEKEGGTLPLESGMSYSDLVTVGFDVYDEEYVYTVSVTAVKKAGAIQTFEISEGWGYQFGVPKIGSFKEYTEDSPCVPEDMEGGEYFGYEDRLSAGCSTWCGCYDYYCEVTASSSLPDQGTQTYGAENLIYESRMNAWAEGVLGDGIGETIEIREMYHGTGDDVFRYNDVCIVNGYAKDETTWQENNRVKSMKLYFADEYMGTITLEDTMLPQYVDLSPVAMKVGNGCEAKFCFEITEVYKGTKYDDTCISGIVMEFEGRNAH